jgi:Zn-dependent M28 family amino/carboxypeptidase
MKTLMVVLAAVGVSLFATEPNSATKSWWAHVKAMAGDSLQGRDTGSEGYRKAAAYVVEQFRRAGLSPAGEKGGWYQTVPLHAVRVRTDQSEIALVRKDGSRVPLHWLRNVTLTARAGLPESVDAPLMFEGSGPADDPELKGKILVRLGAAAGGAGGGRRGGAAAAVNGAVGTLTIDASGGPEPPKWPVAYAVSVTVSDAAANAIGAAAGRGQGGGGGVALRLSSAAADELLAGSGHTYRELADLAAERKPLPRFAIPATLRARIKVESADLQSDNVLGVLPGSDPALANEYIVIAAHLDGYGIGEPWAGDRIYNGAFDDAAYVATMIDFAEKLQAAKKKLKRPVLFAVWTGEEKGLLGSRYFVAHPTVPKERLAANVNLDQLRPIFPLKTLTALAVDESSLGDTARRVAASMDIRIQPDPEPGRNLLRRSDHWNFMQIGVPAIGFIFGYEPGSADETVYRRWYAERYHTPKDDLDQPWDPAAAAKFNAFFGKLVEALADGAERPAWKPGSQYAK